MKTKFLKELYKKHLFLVCDGFENWQDAVKMAVSPLIHEGYVEDGYAEGIVNHVNEMGPYIFLAPHICMPHCKAYQYVNKPGVCFMKSNQPVIANPEEPEMGAELFFALAAENEGAHLDAIQNLVEIFEDEELIDHLISAKTDADFRTLLEISDE